MRVFDVRKEYELSYYDLEKGYLESDKLFIRRHPEVYAQEEVGHYETVKEYSNGGKEVKWVVDIPKTKYQAAYDEYEDIQVYVPYNDKQLAAMEIETLKRNLANTDYQAIKYSEGVMTESEYAPIKQQRKDWRYRINYLQAYYNI